MHFTGGVRYGNTYSDAFNASWPFARLVIEPGAIHLNTTFFKSFSFPKEELIALSRYSGVFSRGLLIEHRVREYPSFVVFWTSKLEEVEKAIEQNGFTMGRT
jgi:hypothetical protein